MDLYVSLKHNTNCFISLPQKIVHSLLVLAEKNSKSLGSLSLELRWYDKELKKENRGYVGWAGGATDPTTQLQDSIEMSPEMALCLGLVNGQKVRALALNNVELATSVQVEPVTSDDWEIMEVHQEYLEEQILNQINILFHGQKIPIWIHHKTLIHLQVLETSPSNIVKISQNSEIIVAPKPRQQNNSGTTQKDQNSRPALAFTPRYLFVQDYIKEITFDISQHFNNSIFISKELMEKFYWQDGDIIEISNNSKKKGSKFNDTDELDDDELDQQQQQQQLENQQLQSKHQTKVLYCRIYSRNDLKDNYIRLSINQRNICNIFINTFVKLRYLSSHALPICPITNITISQVNWKNLNQFYKSTNKNIIQLTNNQLKQVFKDWLLEQNQRIPLVNNSILSIPLNRNNEFIDIIFNFNTTQQIQQPQLQQQQQQQQQPHVQQQQQPHSHQENGSIMSEFIPRFNDFGLPPQDNNQNQNLYRQQQQQQINNNNLYQKSYGLYMINKDFLKDQPDILIGTNENIKFLEDFYNYGDILNRIGGLNEKIKKSKEFLSLLLNSDYSKLRKQLLTPGVNGLIITGSHGIGKSLLATGLGAFYSQSKESNSFVMLLGCLELKDVKVETIRSKLKKLFDYANSITNRSILIILDDLDAILSNPNDQDPGSGIRSNQISEYIQKLCSQYANREYPLALIATSQSTQSLAQSIQVPEVFGCTIELNSPTREERVEIFEKYLEANDIQLKNSSQSNLTTNAMLMKYSSHLEGFLGIDIEQLIERSIHLSTVKSIKENTMDSYNPNELEFQCLQDSLEGFTPITLKGIKLHSSDIKWSDIGGLDEIRATLKETIEWPSKYPKLFQSSPLRLRSGILLYGPTGCGKTLLASAIAGECGLNFISVKGPELLSKYIGSSEQAVRDVFNRASSARPCVLFFDEFDSIAPRRGHDSTGVTDRVVNQFLTQLDGVEGLSGVYVLAATSRPDLIDPALLRPGRLDKSLYCNIPSSNERLDILKTLANKMNIAKDVKISDLAENTEGYTGADLRALMYNSQLKSIHEWMENQESLKKLKKEKELLDKEITEQQSYIVFQPTNNNNNDITTQEEKSKLLKQIESIKSQYKIDNINNGKQKERLDSEEPPVITSLHIEKALLDSTPSISPSDRKKSEAIYNNFLKERGVVVSNKKEGPKQTLA